MILSTTCVSGPMVMMIFGTSSFVRCRRRVRSRSVLFPSDSLARCWSSRRFNLSWSNPKTKTSANRSMNPRKFLGPPQFVAGRDPVGSGAELRSVRFACPSPDRASTLQACESSHVWLHRHRRTGDGGVPSGLSLVAGCWPEWPVCQLCRGKGICVQFSTSCRFEYVPRVKPQVNETAPRARGDGPSIISSSSMMVFCSPRTRGWTTLPALR